MPDSSNRRRSRLLFACTVSLTAADEIQLLPAGEFAARDGRPGKGRTWRIDAAIAAALIALASARTTPFVIDYEHQTLQAAGNGQPAPAAGWFTKLEWRDGRGLYATDVQWTERAKAMIDAGEYRFLSPVFRADDTSGSVLELAMAALTNYPALDGMDAIAARHSLPDQPPETLVNETLKNLLAALGLPETTDEAEALTAVTSLKAAADSAQAELVALKTAAPDPAKFVPIDAMKALQTEVAALTTQIIGREIDGLVGGAIGAGKLLPAQEKWARDLGAKDLAALKGYLDTAQPIAALVSQQGKGQVGKTGEDSATVISAKATKYMAEQAAAGNPVGLLQAVRYVTQA